MKPLSLDVRRRVVAAVSSGENRSSVARRFNISRQTVYNLLHGDEVFRKRLADAAQNGGLAVKLPPGVLELMRCWVRDGECLTLRGIQERLRQELDISVSQVAIWKRMKSINLDWKKNKRTSVRLHAAAS